MESSDKEKEIREVIEEKQKELNDLKLQEDKTHHIGIYTGRPTQKKLKKAEEMVREYCGDNINIKRFFFAIVEIFYSNFGKGNSFVFLTVGRFGIQVTISGALADDQVKKDMSFIMDLAKTLMKKGDRSIGATGIKGIIIPEIKNSGINVIDL